MTTPTREQISATIEVVRAVADTIKDLGEIPSGHLYANLMGSLTIEQYNATIKFLKDAKLVSESNNVLKWEGVR